MATTTKTPNLADFYNVDDAVQRWTEATRKAGNDYLDLYDKAVDQITELEVKTAAVSEAAARLAARRHARHADPRGRRRLLDRRARPAQGLALRALDAVAVLGAAAAPALRAPAPTNAS